MLNLLIISDSSKAVYVKSVLQPDLKVIIDVVTDFDLGLKNVFEKRPSTVCIQDQIGGVTGENVARHIQMLLGNSSPKFVLLHTGNSKARLIKGLYDYIVDLSQSNETVAEDITNSLKSLMGDAWEKIYIPPKLAPALVRSSAAVHEESPQDTDKLLDDDAPSTMETSVTSEAPYLISASTLKTAARKAPEKRLAAIVEKAISLAADDGSASVVNGMPRLAPVAMKPAPAELKPMLVAVKPALVVVKPAASAVPATAAPSAPVINVTPLVKKNVPIPENIKVPPAAAPGIQSPLQKQAAAVTPPGATASSVNQNTPSSGTNIPEAPNPVLNAINRKRLLNVRRSFVIALSCVMFAAGGLYLAKQDLHLAALQNQLNGPSPELTPAPNAVPDIQSRQQVVTPPLPAFIPQDGHDPTYVEKNPGWERYVGETAEFRVFIDSGRVQAVQVLLVNNVPISKSMMKAVLQEFTGNPAYRITSRSRESGVLVESGIIQDSHEVMLYRQNGAIIAFVVSIA